MRLHHLRPLRHLLQGAQRFVLVRIFGARIDPLARLSLSARIDLTNPKGVVIGPYSYVAFGATILTHDFVRELHCDTIVGSHCFVGANATVLPGIRIGDHCIIAAGAVVTADVPSGSIVAGNPARVIRSGLRLRPYGQMPRPARDATSGGGRPEAGADPLADR